MFSDPMDFFVIDPLTGELRTAKRLDREALQDTNGVIHVQIRVKSYEIGASILCANRTTKSPLIFH